jgi:hypothetical protein
MAWLELPILAVVAVQDIQQEAPLVLMAVLAS